MLLLMPMLMPMAMLMLVSTLTWRPPRSPASSHVRPSRERASDEGLLSPPLLARSMLMLMLMLMPMPMPMPMSTLTVTWCLLCACVLRASRQWAGGRAGKGNGLGTPCCRRADGEVRVERCMLERSGWRGVDVERCGRGEVRVGSPDVGWWRVLGTRGKARTHTHTCGRPSRVRRSSPPSREGRKPNSQPASQPATLAPGDQRRASQTSAHLPTPLPVPSPPRLSLSLFSLFFFSSSSTSSALSSSVNNISCALHNSP